MGYENGLSAAGGPGDARQNVRGRCILGVLLVDGMCLVGRRERQERLTLPCKCFKSKGIILYATTAVAGQNEPSAVTAVDGPATSLSDQYLDIPPGTSEFEKRLHVNIVCLLSIDRTSVPTELHSYHRLTGDFETRGSETPIKALQPLAK